MEKTLIVDFEKIFLEIYLIGYPNEGESIIFLVRTEGNQGQNVFTGIIDSFSLDRFNCTDNMLQHFNIQKLDFLCWTHPDADHSLGIDTLLDKYANNETLIVLPYALLEYRDKLNSNTCDLCNAFAATIEGKRDKVKYKVKGVQHGLLAYRRIFKDLKGDSYNFRIDVLAPDPTIISSQYHNKCLENNTFSIVLLVQLAGINILFTGDLENRTLQYLSDDIELPSKIHYVKIPHHGSLGSSQLLDLLGSNDLSDIACTTVYTKSNLPNQSILDGYKLISNNVICTADIVNSGNVGIVGTQYDIKDKTVIHKTSNDLTSF